MLADRVRMGSGSRHDDEWGTPGNLDLIAGTMEEGFFGEVSTSQLITGDNLASTVGLSAGTSQYSNYTWMKFAYKGKIQFIAKRPFRRRVTWNDLYNANVVSGSKRITIGSFRYRVRLLRGANSLYPGAASGSINHYSEWNRLMCQVHEQAIDGTWGNNSSNVEDDIGILEHNLGWGKNGMYRDSDLNTNAESYGFSAVDWCQETAQNSDYRIYRGISGSIAFSGSHTRDHLHGRYGWRPVLELY